MREMKRFCAILLAIIGVLCGILMMQEKMFGPPDYDSADESGKSGGFSKRKYIKLS